MQDYYSVMANIVIGLIGLLIASGGVWYYFVKRPRLKIDISSWKGRRIHQSRGKKYLYILNLEFKISNYSEKIAYDTKVEISNLENGSFRYSLEGHDDVRPISIESPFYINAEYSQVYIHETDQILEPIEIRNRMLEDLIIKLKYRNDSRLKWFYTIYNDQENNLNLFNS